MPEAKMTDTVWDPFNGRMPFQRDKAEAAKAGVQVPGWLKSALMVMALAGMVAVIVTGIFFEAYLFHAVAVLVLGFAGSMLIDKLSGEKSRKRSMFAALAEAKGWAYARTKHVDGKQDHDPLIAPAAAKIPELLRPHPGQPMMTMIEAVYWGKTAQGLPFWLGVEQVDADMTLAAAALKQDRMGNKGGAAKLWNMIAAYRLDRDTGIRAKLLAEAPMGDLFRDVKTESDEFNRAFNVSVEPRSTAEGDEVLQLMRALTPATQATLLDLRARYHAQVIIDGDTVFVGGWDKLNTRDAAAVESYLGTLVEDFANAATLFKAYVE